MNIICNSHLLFNIILRNLIIFTDLAVGAPFENDCGAVYIYYASSLFFDEQRRQKILGKTISPELKGFGVSFTRPKDVDNNGYLGKSLIFHSYFFFIYLVIVMVKKNGSG